MFQVVANIYTRSNLWFVLLIRVMVDGEVTRRNLLWLMMTSAGQILGAMLMFLCLCIHHSAVSRNNITVSNQISRIMFRLIIIIIIIICCF